MSANIFEGVTVLIDDGFYTSEDNEQEKKKKKKNTASKNYTNLKNKKSKVSHNEQYNILEKNMNENSNDKSENSVSSDDDQVNEFEKQNNNKYNNLKTKKNEEYHYFNLDNYLGSDNDLNEENEQSYNNQTNKKVKGISGKVWNDSEDDEYDDDSYDRKLDRLKIIQDNDHLNDNICIDAFDEKVNVEDISVKGNRDINAFPSEDIYIYDNKDTDYNIYNTKKNKKQNEKCIFLKYRLHQYTFNQINEKKIKQIVSLPNKNIILSVYKNNLYVMEYKDEELNASKKLKFNKILNYVEEYNESSYILSNDIFLRKYDMTKDAIYKTRVHNPNTVLIPKEIKFYTKNNNLNDETKDEFSDLYSMSFYSSNKINIYDTRSYDIVKSFELSNRFIGMNFHKKTNRLFAIDSKGYIYNWCLNTNKLINKMMDNYSVFPSAFEVYKDYLVTCSFNGFLNLFDINNLNKPIKSFKNLTHSIRDVVFSPAHNCLLYYTHLLKNGIRMVNLDTKYVYCNIPWLTTRSKYNIYAANFFNNGNNFCFATSSNSFYVYDICGYN
ncbi:conserved Plasmodium protein, unknown function [Plasmodium berghei]|uniref:WD repeat-containing protein, putative n=3 Tax=Plasmodium berghei TaxID=5821 RepID=A0A509B0R5_PLABA|nr:WD repeat-containing protein, putative [Plasmodium berghei ANKA]CXJ22457.1 conserved Plasmodium protein, unknown function [Plasmodium berghei]SCN28572.1 conserved Plasmodium protein, unknown function [Plasmodium berghei]SCO62761.1 conserved Plasmodium protein, unknown function [Plasmodium berghei]SCO64321.1 conserved Plasmodium protein, unknown function [Plasmodium berghei]VUC58454.1 WD repeat-containing protein, putative [Plasmodium berghei ANKA]|eukprot:XP_034424217.1 WD repeat-containing protein, putative [Plasmodium berghei ANKA]